MTIGIAQFRARRDLWLDRMMLQPLRGRAGGWNMGRSAMQGRDHED